MRGISRRLSCARALLLAAAPIIASAEASAALKLEITLEGFSPGGGTGSPGKTLLLTPLDVGDPVTLWVWATVTGADNTSTANDGLQILNAAFGSVGPILGDMNNLTHDPDFNENGTANGAHMGTPGDYDLGSTNTALASGWWIGRSKPVQSTTGPASDGLGNLLLGTITFTPTDMSTFGTTLLQMDYRHSTNGALWFEDATINTVPDPDVWSNDRNPSTGTITIGEPITIVPEPGSLALVGVAAAAALRRRRK